MHNDNLAGSPPAGRSSWTSQQIVYTIEYKHSIQAMHFEWDERKNTANFLKHGVWFEEAVTVWRDPLVAASFDSLHSLSEERYLLLGMSEKGSLLAVCFTENEQEETIRIISTRKATAKERRFYEERIRLFQT
jgi:uncharacterized DUF497 family protein